MTRATLDASARAVLDFWFGPDPDSPPRARTECWFAPNQDFERELRERFADLTAQALAGDTAGWSRSPRGRLALLLTLDQFPRNLFRGEARAFAGDSRALAQALQALSLGEDRQFSLFERFMLGMPLQHAEDPVLQRQSVAHFQQLASEDARGHPLIQGGVAFAEAHADAIRRFGRFPQRNAVLARQSSSEELAYLAGERMF